MLRSEKTPGAGKRATNVTLTAALLAEAKALSINISQAAEAGLVQAIAEKRAAVWIKENRAALNSSNSFVESQGLPLSNYRLF